MAVLDTSRPDWQDLGMRTTQAPLLLSTLERASLGAVARIYPPELVDEILLRYDRKEERRRALPARLMVYFVIAMGLFSASAYREVLHNLVDSLRQLRAWADHWQVPTRGGISVARQRLGVEPLRALFDAIARPMLLLITPDEANLGCECPG